MQKAKVSVLLPVYNALTNYPDGMLKRCLDSIWLQDVPLELIIVDDGSDDGTYELLKKEVHNFNISGINKVARLGTHHRANLGQAAALNTAMGMASGEYVHQFSIRAWYETGGLPALAQALDDHPDVGFAYGDLRVHHWRGKTWVNEARVYNRDEHLTKYLAKFHIYRRDAWTRGCVYADYLIRDGRWIGITDRDFVMKMIVNLGWDGVAIPGRVCVHYYRSHSTTDIVGRYEDDISAAYEARWNRPRFSKQEA